MTALSSYPLGKHFLVSTEAFRYSYWCEQFKTLMLTSVIVMLGA